MTKAHLLLMMKMKYQIISNIQRCSTNFCNNGKGDHTDTEPGESGGGVVYCEGRINEE